MSKKSRLKKLESPQAPRNVDNTRGSHLWAYNHFRINILTSLLNDLIEMENEGLTEEYCSQVRKSLEYFINASTNVPQGGFLSGGPLYKEIESFSETYTAWNDINGKSPENTKYRRKLVGELRKKRQKITDKVRKLQYELDNNLDQKILEETYNAIGNLVNMVPNLFKNLSSSYKTYLKVSA